MKRFLFIVPLLISFQSKAIVDTSLFETYAPFAKAVEFVTGIPASIQLAQVYNETGFGSAGPALSCNNWFSIKDYDLDYWPEHCYDWNWNKTVKVRWRSYSCGLISWIDYAVFIVFIRGSNLGKHWKHWINHPIKYGGKGYWKRVGKTIIQYNLHQYDLR